MLRENIDQDTRKRIRWEVARLWQNAWESSEKGRITFCYFQTILGRMTLGWISLNHYVTQFLTGHGNFHSKLADLRCIEDGSCVCGEIESMQHVLLDCELVREEKTELLQGIEGVGATWLAVAPHLVEELAFRRFSSFASNVLSLKEADTETTNA